MHGAGSREIFGTRLHELCICIGAKISGDKGEYFAPMPMESSIVQAFGRALRAVTKIIKNTQNPTPSVTLPLRYSFFCHPTQEHHSVTAPP